ncbi:hypothetical protein [Ammoniphilus resinae]|uniref:HTH merR-type domain-containing protein n=1 Tax=Ammoniphilus resinae TaxID=861532 RepID=A0ABS4GNX3_9BACL|nr:hypothetical protein [Ammoniphilus resinae]MBP1931959.1 hypothetical protein [Ammoniphilus resinae]
METLLNTSQVLKLLSKAGITSSRQQVLKWVRAELIRVEKPSSKKEGYLFKASEVRRFIMERKPLIPDDLIELAEKAGTEYLEGIDESKDKVKLKNKEIRDLKEKIHQLELDLSSLREIDGNSKARLKELESMIIVLREQLNNKEVGNLKEVEDNYEEMIKQKIGEIESLNKQIDTLMKNENNNRGIIKQKQDEIICLKRELESKDKENKRLIEQKVVSKVPPEWEKNLRLKIEAEYKDLIKNLEDDLKYYKEDNKKMLQQLWYKPLPSPEESGEITFVQFQHLWNNRIKKRIEKGWHERRVFWDFVSLYKKQDDILSFDTHRSKFVCPFCEKPFVKLVTMLTHAANEYAELKDDEWSSLGGRQEARLLHRDKSIEELTEKYQQEMAKLMANPEINWNTFLLPVIWALRMKGVNHAVIPVPVELIKEAEEKRPIRIDWEQDGTIVVTPCVITEIVRDISYEDERKNELDFLKRYLFFEFYDRKKDTYKPHPFKKIKFTDFHYEYNGEKIPFGKGQEVPDPYDFVERLRFSEGYNEYKKRQRNRS